VGQLWASLGRQWAPRVDPCMSGKARILALEHASGVYLKGSSSQDSPPVSVGSSYTGCVSYLIVLN